MLPKQLLTLPNWLKPMFIGCRFYGSAGFTECANTKLKLRSQAFQEVWSGNPEAGMVVTKAHELLPVLPQEGRVKKRS
jgi:hypothetical protein